MPFVPLKSGYYVVSGTSSLGCTSKDSCFIDFFTVQPVNYEETSKLIGKYDQAINVTPGSPLGGFYAGNGVIGTSFHPALAGIGSHYIVYSIVDANGCTSSDSSEIQVYDNIGLNELDLEIQLFPNPAKDYLVIKADKIVDMTCYSMEGRKMQDLRIEKEYVLDTSKYSSGMYLLVFKTDGESKRMYFLKH
jgi:hypothetical protein